MPVCLGDFAESAKPISASMPLAAVVDRFLNDPHAQYFILVRDKRPAGLISRTLTFEFDASAGQHNHAALAEKVVLNDLKINILMRSSLADVSLLRTSALRASSARRNCKRR